MNLANKYMMRSSGESIHQPNGYAESVAMSVIDTLKGIESFSIGITTLVEQDKANLESLNDFIESLVKSVNKNARLYEDFNALLKVIKNNSILNAIYLNSSVDDIEKLSKGLIGTIEIIRPLNTPVSKSENNSFFWQIFYSFFWQQGIGVN
jgi:hypothetical protein